MAVKWDYTMKVYFIGLFIALNVNSAFSQFNFFECAKNPSTCKQNSKQKSDTSETAITTPNLIESSSKPTGLDALHNNELIPNSKPLIFANRKALVIGNDEYKYVSTLRNAVFDAQSMADGLTKVGYQVTLKTNLDDKGMKLALRNFKLQVDAGDEVAFFYSGHGVQFGQSNYLLPVDIAGDNEDQVKDESMPLERLLADMLDKRAKFTLAMIDACRDNPFKGNGRAISSSRGLAPTTAATGQMIVFSAGNGQQALDSLGPTDSEKNGLFTRVFIKEMQTPGVSIDRIVRSVRTQVAEKAKSVGREQVPSIYDQVIGEFYFNK